MSRPLFIAVCVLALALPQARGQSAPSYAKDVRPFLAKYCLECHNSKSAKGGLDLETYKAILEGGNKGDVLVPGKPDESRLVTLVEGKDKPAMPPKTARLQPKPAEVAVLRAWVKAGARDDSALIKVAIPDIKPRVSVQPPVSALAFQPGAQLLAAGSHNLLQLLEIPGGTLKKRLPQSRGVSALAFSKDGALLAVALSDPGESGSVSLLRTKDASAAAPVLDLHRDSILDLAISPDGRWLATAGYDTTIRLVDIPSALQGAATATTTRTLNEHSDSVYGLAFSPDSKLLASCAADRAVKVWDVDTGKLLYTLGEATDWLYALAWRPNGTQFASAGVDKSIRVYRVSGTAGKIVHSVFAHEGPVQKIAYAPDGKTLYSLGQDRVLKAWDADKMVERKVYDRLPETGLSLAVRDDLVAVGRYDGVVQLIDPRTGATKAEWGGKKSAVQGKAQTSNPSSHAADAPLFPSPPGNPGGEGQGEGGQHPTRSFPSLPGVQVVARHDVPLTPTPLPRSTGGEGMWAPLAFPRSTGGEGMWARLAYLIASGLVAVQADAKKPADPFPLLQAKPGHNSPGTGQMVKLPVSIAGKLDRTGDVDFFRFEARKGQQLGVQVLTKEIASRIEPILQLTDRRGKVLAESSAGHLGYVFPEDGIYSVGVRDREFRGGPDMHYKLHLGDIPVVISLFPLGVQRGQEKAIRVKGVFLSDQGNELFVKVRVPADAAVGSKIPLPLKTAQGKPLGPTEIVVGEFVESSASEKEKLATPSLSVPGTGNGLLQKFGQQDVWQFSAKKGQPLVIEVQARRLGSALDSVIEVLDARGQPVPRAVLRCQARTFVTFRDHDSVQPNIRIEAWSELAVNDFIYVNGELMKIQSLPTHPDADCIFFSAAGQRTGFLDTTPTHHSVNEPMYKVTLHPPGAVFPPNGYPVFTLYYRNDDGGPGYGRDSKLIFDPPADGVYQVRVADSRGQYGDNFGYRLTVRPPRPSFKVSFTPTAPTIARGGALPITVTAERFDGYDGPIQVQFTDLPKGLSAPPTYIEPGLTTTALALYAAADAPSPGKAKLRMSAHALIDGQKQTKEVEGGTPSLIEPGEIVCWTEQDEVTIKPGKQTKLTVHIERRLGFKGRVPLDVRGLPHGVRVLDLGLNGILITEKETQRTIVIYAEPWVEASAHPFVVFARREGKNTEHAAKSVLLKVSEK